MLYPQTSRDLLSWAPKTPEGQFYQFLGKQGGGGGCQKKVLNASPTSNGKSTTDLQKGISHSKLIPRAREDKAVSEAQEGRTDTTLPNLCFLLMSTQPIGSWRTFFFLLQDFPKAKSNRMKQKKMASLHIKACLGVLDKKDVA
jgi:hypothetical protein